MRCLLYVASVQTYRRIVRVDLKFPEKPVVSEGAKDFIRKVCVLCRSRCAGTPVGCSRGVVSICAVVEAMSVSSGSVTQGWLLLLSFLLCVARRSC